MFPKKTFTNPYHLWLYEGIVQLTRAFLCIYYLYFQVFLYPSLIFVHCMVSLHCQLNDYLVEPNLPTADTKLLGDALQFSEAQCVFIDRRSIISQSCTPFATMLYITFLCTITGKYIKDNVTSNMVHGDIMIRKHFRHYLAFVREIHRLSVDPLRKRKC